MSYNYKWHKFEFNTVNEFDVWYHELYYSKGVNTGLLRADNGWPFMFVSIQPNGLIIVLAQVKTQE